MLKQQSPINIAPLHKMEFYLPDYHPTEGYPMPQEHEDLQEELIDTFPLVYFSSGEQYSTIYEDLATDPCTKYTVFLENDSRQDAEKLTTIIIKYAQKLSQTEVVVTLLDGTTNIYKV